MDDRVWHECKKRSNKWLNKKVTQIHKNLATVCKASVSSDLC